MPARNNNAMSSHNADAPPYKESLTKKEFWHAVTTQDNGHDIVWAFAEWYRVPRMRTTDGTPDFDEYMRIYFSRAEHETRHKELLLPPFLEWMDDKIVIDGEIYPEPTVESLERFPDEPTSDDEETSAVQQESHLISNDEPQPPAAITSSTTFTDAQSIVASERALLVKEAHEVRLLADRLAGRTGGMRTTISRFFAGMLSDDDSDDDDNDGDSERDGYRWKGDDARDKNGNDDNNGERNPGFHRSDATVDDDEEEEGDGGGGAPEDRLSRPASEPHDARDLEDQEHSQSQVIEEGPAGAPGGSAMISSPSRHKRRRLDGDVDQVEVEESLEEDAEEQGGPSKRQRFEEPSGSSTQMALENTAPGLEMIPYESRHDYVYAPLPDHPLVLGLFHKDRIPPPPPRNTVAYERYYHRAPHQLRETLLPPIVAPRILPRIRAPHGGPRPNLEWQYLYPDNTTGEALPPDPEPTSKRQRDEEGEDGNAPAKKGRWSWMSSFLPGLPFSHNMEPTPPPPPPLPRRSSMGPPETGPGLESFPSTSSIGVDPVTTNFGQMEQWQRDVGSQSGVDQTLVLERQAQEKRERKAKEARAEAARKARKRTQDMNEFLNWKKNYEEKDRFRNGSN